MKNIVEIFEAILDADFDALSLKVPKKSEFNNSTAFDVVCSLIGGLTEINVLQVYPNLTRIFDAVDAELKAIKATGLYDPTLSEILTTASQLNSKITRYSRDYNNIVKTLNSNNVRNILNYIIECDKALSRKMGRDYNEKTIHWALFGAENDLCIISSLNEKDSKYLKFVLDGMNSKFVKSIDMTKNAAGKYIITISINT